jgi:DNA excision repair protein ERCC-5
VDGSREVITFARPDLEHLRNFCTDKFGWVTNKTDELMVPVLKVPRQYTAKYTGSH